MLTQYVSSPSSNSSTCPFVVVVDIVSPARGVLPFRAVFLGSWVRPHSLADRGNQLTVEKPDRYGLPVFVTGKCSVERLKSGHQTITFDSRVGVFIWLLIALRNENVVDSEPSAHCHRVSQTGVSVMGRTPPRAVVADDSYFMRSVITDILEDGGIEVVAQASDGVDAIEAVADHRPDVVTMDVEMPKLDGIEATEHIMSEHPTPIVMLSAHTDDDADVTFQALDRGAVDFFTKPGGEVSMEMSRLKDQLVEMVTSVAQADVGGETATTDRASDPVTHAYVDNPTLLIGSSTGGPKTVERVISRLPLEADFRILIVQHMPEGFTERFARRIDSQTEYAVSEAAHGDRIGGGEILVAPGGMHMVVSNYHSGRIRVKLVDDPPVNSVRPSVDVTMSSAAEVIDDPLIGVILTGMGKDGADGITALKAVGAKTVAQDESTSAVFGMPKRAIETGDIDEVLPIAGVPDGILSAARAESAQKTDRTTGKN